jgi:tRNA pseudouridine38-40 synthase
MDGATTPQSRSERKRRFRATQNASSSAQDTPAASGTRKLKKSAFLPLHADETVPPTSRRCVVEYDGTLFHGFQAQENGGAMRTVQETIEDAVARTTGERVRVRGCSRTDKGVHARGQVVVFESRCASGDRAFRDALNTRLPEDVVCRSLRALPSSPSLTASAEDVGSFDPRANAVGKIYEYVIVTGPVRPVLDRHRVWFMKKPLDTQRMRQAMAYLTAAPVEKDYSAFTPPKSSQQNRDTCKGNVCRLRQVELVEEPLRPLEEDEEEEVEQDEERQHDTGVRIRIRFHGDRFLYKMVRNLVGTLVDVGLGRIQPDELAHLLETRDRSKAGQGAPPQGLTLVRVLYKTDHEKET